MFAKVVLALSLVASLGPAELATPEAEKVSPVGLSKCVEWDDWDKPTPPFRIYGETYYVGTCGIAVILINTPQGSIVIDGGPRGSGAQIARNIESLGFDLRNVRLHLISHEHHDHIGGLADLQRRTGAMVAASAAAKPALESGEAVPEDPLFDLHESFDSVRVDRTIHEHDHITRNFQIGGLTVTPVATPGHTPGAMSYFWQSCEGEECRTIVYADSMSPVSADSYRFSDHPAYLAAYRAALDRLAALDCDILLTPHPSASNMLKRLGGEEPLFEPQGCRNYAKSIEERLNERVASETNG